MSSELGGSNVMMQGQDCLQRCTPAPDVANCSWRFNQQYTCVTDAVVTHKAALLAVYGCAAQDSPATPLPASTPCVLRQAERCMMSPLFLHVPCCHCCCRHSTMSFSWPCQTLWRVHLETAGAAKVCMCCIHPGTAQHGDTTEHRSIPKVYMQFQTASR